MQYAEFYKNARNMNASKLKLNLPFIDSTFLDLSQLNWSQRVSFTQDISNAVSLARLETARV